MSIVTNAPPKVVLDTNRVLSALLRSFLDEYLPYTQTITKLEALPEPNICRDSNDVMFLELALAGEANYLSQAIGICWCCRKYFNLKLCHLQNLLTT